MKYLFFLVSVIAGISFSFISVIYANGKIPFKAAPVADAAEVKVAEKVRTITVFTDQAGVVDDLIEVLNQERAKYEKKDAELKSRDAAVDTQREMIARMKATIEELEGKLNTKVIEIESSEIINIKRLATVYSKMDPNGASNLLMLMDPDKAAKIINLTGDRQAAAILDAAVANGGTGKETAAKWSDAIRRIKNDKAGKK